MTSEKERKADVEQQRGGHIGKLWPKFHWSPYEGNRAVNLIRFWPEFDREYVALMVTAENRQRPFQFGGIRRCRFVPTAEEI